MAHKASQLAVGSLWELEEQEIGKKVSYTAENKSLKVIQPFHPSMN
jgi:hypothetical protein